MHLCTLEVPLELVYFQAFYRYNEQMIQNFLITFLSLCRSIFNFQFEFVDIVLKTIDDILLSIGVIFI